jgi:hypothetical protein
MRPSLKWLNHSLSDPHCIIAESLLNFADCFHLGIPKFLAELDAVSLLQAFCHLEQHVLPHFAIWQRQTHPAVLRGSKKSRMRMKVPSTTTLSFPTISPLLIMEKNVVIYFVDRPHIHTWDGGNLCNKFVIYACQFVLLG